MITSGKCGNEEVFSASFVLTPAAGKKLIGMGVAALPEVQKAFKSHRLAVANGTTATYVIEALTGESMNRFDYCVGLLTDGQFAESADTTYEMVVWEKGERTIWSLKEGAKLFGSFERDDVLIKGANAVDPYGYVGGLMSNPVAGTWGAFIGILAARGIHPIVPIGQEKMIPSVIEAARKMGQLRVNYTLGNPVGLMPFTTGKVVTEVEALEQLAGVCATPVAGGGIGGAEGARAFVVEGTQAQVEKALELVQKVYKEPATQMTGNLKIEPKLPS